jgi:hypothetical protein
MSDDKQQFHFISQLNAVPAEGLARIPILVTGSWVKGGRDVSFTHDELCQAVENFQKLANHDLNVDYDHACEDLERAGGAPTPSAGRILALDEPEPFKSGDGEMGRSGEPESRSADHPVAGSTARWILYGRYEPTSRARQMIKNREYRYVSAAFAKDYPDRKTGESQGLTLTSVALTNQPFLDELPEIWLSVSGDRMIGRSGEQEGRSPHHRITGSTDQLTRLSAEQGGEMPMLNLKYSADGKHEAYDGDRKVGEIDNDHLCDYAAQHAASKGGAEQDKLSARGAGISTLSTDAYAAFASEVGAEGRTQEEIRNLVALALYPPKAEATLLCESIGADGRLNLQRLDALDDSGRVSRSAWRRAKDAEQRVLSAFQRGQITPAMMASGAPLRLALADGAAFKSLVEDRPPMYKPNSVTGLGGTGCETGESPRQLFSRLVEEKKQQLLQVEPRLNELDAHRKAGALVAKNNPDLLKNYRSDAKPA